MAFLDAATTNPPSPSIPIGTKVLGLALSALLPLAAAFAMAGLVAFLGLGDAAPLYSDPLEGPVLRAAVSRSGARPTGSPRVRATRVIVPPTGCWR